MNADTSPLIEWLFRTTWQSAVLVCLIWAVLFLLRKQIKPHWRYWLWMLVAMRLVMPISPNTSFSIFNLSPDPVVRVLAMAPETQTPGEVRAPEAGLFVPPTNQEEPQTAVLPPSASGSVTLAPMKSGWLKTWKTFFSWKRILLICWVAGMATVLYLTVVRSRRFSRVVQELTPVEHPEVLQVLEECRRQIGLRGLVGIKCGSPIISPAVYGWWRPQILLPQDFLSRLRPIELRFVLLHELAHVKRGDIALNWMMAMIQAVHWFNPFVWFAFARLRSDRELACDAHALMVAGKDHAEAYGRTMIKLLENFSSPLQIPGAAGILEDPREMQRRLKMIMAFRPSPKWSMALVMAVALLGLVTFTDAQTKPAPKTETKGAQALMARKIKPAVKSNLHIRGQIKDADGSPLKGATVFIHTAGPREGTSGYCPSCYADCAKKATTDEKGEFKIESVDPTLIFRLLVVAKDRQPYFIEKVDPRQAPIQAQVLRRDLSRIKEDQQVRGVVLDPQNRPVPAAVVVAEGIRGQNTRWGRIEGLDPLAVTDDKGEFLLTHQESIAGMDVMVEARGFANARFINLATGPQRHPLRVNEGASVYGKVTLKGKPLANVSLGLVTSDRGASKMFGPFTIGTDDKGEFLLSNIPEENEYHLFGLMEHLQPFGTIPIRAVKVGKEKELNVGNVEVVPGVTLKGKVQLTDKQELPPKTELLVSRNDAWDSLRILLPADGTFELKNLPTETLNLSARVEGYRVSARNVSFDSLNGFSIIGKLVGDKTDLLLLLEPGKTFPNYSRSLSWDDLPQNNPLAGAEKYQGQPDRVIVGKVTDAETGQPLSAFTVTPGTQFQLNYEWREGMRQPGEKGKFELSFSPNLKLNFLMVEAPGYLPEVVRLSNDALDLKLIKGTGPKGQVLTPEGKPAVNAKVAYIGAMDHLFIQKDFEFQTYQLHPKQFASTDVEGRFSYPALYDKKQLVVLHPSGFLTQKTKPGDDMILRLEPFATVKGVLKGKDNQPLANREVRLMSGFGILPSDGSVSAGNSTKTDQTGRFEFNNVPKGNWVIATRENNRYREHQKISPRPGEALETQVAFKEGDDLDGELSLPKQVATGQKFNGEVVNSQGKPISQADVIAAPKHVYFSLKGKKPQIYDTTKPHATQSDNQGKFQVPEFKEMVNVYAIHEEGFVEVSWKDFLQSKKLILQPWSSLEGVAKLGKEPLGEKLHLTRQRIGTGGLMLFSQTEVMSDNGHFKIDVLPPGLYLVHRMVRTGSTHSQGSHTSHIELTPGNTAKMVYGGSGALVKGMATFKEKSETDWDIFYGLIMTPLTGQNRDQDFWNTQEGLDFQKTRKGYVVKFDKNGQFNCPDVAPGSYSFLVFPQEGGGLPKASEITVKEGQEVVDLGRVEFK